MDVCKRYQQASALITGKISRVTAKNGDQRIKMSEDYRSSKRSAPGKNVMPISRLCQHQYTTSRTASNTAISELGYTAAQRPA